MVVYFDMRITTANNNVDKKSSIESINSPNSGSGTNE